MAASDITAQLLKLAEAPPKDLSDDERKALMGACEKAKVALESPVESTVRLLFGAFETIALRLGIDMGLIDQALAAKGPITASQLASGANADEILVVRVMRNLVGMNFFTEVGHHTYIANPFAATYAAGSPFREGIIHVASQLPPVTLLPEYFATRGFKNPTDAYDGPFQFAFQTKEHYFDWVAQRPRLQSAFNMTMTIQRMQRGQDWFEYYPVEQKLSVSSPSDVLLVDVGGSLGHDVVNFRTKFPNLPGKLIFEDLPPVIAEAKEKGLPETLTALSHNFFEPQPQEARGAKAYYLRTVLHDWPDKQAKQILQQVREAMTPDSLLLINENAMPEDNAALYPAQVDLIMMSTFGALERTVSQFNALLEESGFELLQVYKPNDYGPGSGLLLEAKLKA